MHLGKKIGNVSHMIKRSIDSLHCPYDISGKQSRLLGFIAHESVKRDLYQKDIEEELQIRRSSVTSMLQTLEKAGMIKRVSVVEDARLKKIVLTDLGHEVTQNTYHNIVAFENELSSLFKEDEKVLFYEYLNRIDQYLKEKEEKIND